MGRVSGQRTPVQTASNMRERWGDSAPIHATHTLMGYDRGSTGYTYWLEVLDTLVAQQKAENALRLTLDRSTP
jgi:hypothetical protein